MFDKMNFGVDSFFNPLERFGAALMRPLDRPWRRLVRRVVCNRQGHRWQVFGHVYVCRRCRRKE